MKKITLHLEHLAIRAANRQAPPGYTLWSVYPTLPAALWSRREYGQISDKIKKVLGFYALYGRSA